MTDHEIQDAIQKLAKWLIEEAGIELLMVMGMRGEKGYGCMGGNPQLLKTNGELMLKILDEAKADLERLMRQQKEAPKRSDVKVLYDSRNVN